MTYTYHELRSKFCSQKQSIDLKHPTDIFFVRKSPVQPFIEPSFSAEDWPSKKDPAIALISAIGASGKTTIAHALSLHTEMPILDLAVHGPVASDALTGKLTSSYPYEKLGDVLSGIQCGTYGVIIDGIDEGRSKIEEESFEAFLDDVIQRCRGSSGISVIILGRSQALLNAWSYLGDRIEVGLMSVKPFDLTNSVAYIDSYTTDIGRSQLREYQHARDLIIERIMSATSTSDPLSFVGYPPVLDAIATLLRTERNYLRIRQLLGDDDASSVVVELLIRISHFLLKRDRDEKAKPNFIDAMISEHPDRKGLTETLYDDDEQCARALSVALNRPFVHQKIADSALNALYENSAREFFRDHPFMKERSLRNPVFAAVAIARCARSEVPEYNRIARDYADLYPPSYHLLYMMKQLPSEQISVRDFNMLIQSCSDFLSIDSDISVQISGDDWEDGDLISDSGAELEITIDTKDDPETFSFVGTVEKNTEVSLGPFLVNSHVVLPCPINLVNARGIRVVGRCLISAPKILLAGPHLDVLGDKGGTGSHDDDLVNGLFIDTCEVHQDPKQSVIVSVSRGRQFEIRYQRSSSLAYPLAPYSSKVNPPYPQDSVLDKKYKRLRRILLEFASHGRGGLAKYRSKIENRRVIRDDVSDIGRRVLDRLLHEGVLEQDTRFYYVNKERFSHVLAVTWLQLRRGESSRQMQEFLGAC